MVEESLFIGGPHDGKRMAVERRLHDVFLPDCKSRPRQDIVTEVAKGWISTHHYRRERLSGESVVFSIFMHESLSVDQMLHLLIEGYRR